MNAFGGCSVIRFTSGGVRSANAVCTVTMPSPNCDARSCKPPKASASSVLCTVIVVSAGSGPPFQRKVAWNSDFNAKPYWLPITSGRQRYACFENQSRLCWPRSGRKTVSCNPA